jgi:hypothetical protein
MSIPARFFRPDILPFRAETNGRGAMPEIPIYRPEITVYEREPDGEWDSKFGAQVHTGFRPMPDEDGAFTQAGFRRFVRGGSAPSFTLRIPHGAELVERGAATFLRTAEGKLLNGIEALIAAKRGEHGLELAGPERERRLRAIAFDPRPAASAPTVQLSMF